MKKFLLSIIFITLTSFAFALPGFTSFIPDTAGEYVYYKDGSFSRESYVGLLCYDANTYQIRYYAPSTLSNPVEKIVAALFTIDSKKDHFEMTGENVIVADYSNPEDVDIVNYLHDILYEFSARRSKLDSLTPSTENYVNFVGLRENGLKISDEYTQFGGDVKIIYDCMIPFFNIKRIEDAKGNAIFECVQLGKINSTEDKSFDRFVAIPDNAKVKINSVKQKKAEPVNFVLENQTITLDKTWEAKSANMWVQGDDAIISMATYMNPQREKYFCEYYLIRNLLESKDNYFIILNKCDVIFGKDVIKIYSENYLEKSSKIFYGIKYLTLNSDENYDFVSFVATKANYLQKRSYYDKIMKSYSN